MSTSNQNPTLRHPFSKSGLDAFGKLITPSWLSGLLAFVAGLALVAGTVLLLHYNGSTWQLLATGHQQPAQVSENVDYIETDVQDNSLVSSLPLLIFWAGVGLIVYFFVTALITALRQVLDLKDEVNYVHANRQQLIKSAVTHLVVRLCSLGLWILYVQLTIHSLVPYIIALTYAGNGGLGWLLSAVYLTGAVVIAALGLHLHTILLRLLVLRPRLFGQSI